jgi:hypothetical protein
MRLGRSVLNFMLGRRLAKSGNQEQVERKITAFKEVPAMGLDGGILCLADRRPSLVH